MGVLDYLSATGAGNMDYLDTEGGTGGGGGGGGPTAANLVTYDHAASGLAATDVQAAIDEVKSDIPVIPVFSGARVTNTAGTSIPNNTPTPVPFATEDFDTDGFHSTVTNNTRLTIPTGKDGYYLLIGNALVGGTSGDRFINWWKNGTEYLSFSRELGSLQFGQGTSAIVHLVAGDYVELRLTQGSGGAQPLDTTPGVNFASIVRIGGAPANGIAGQVLAATQAANSVGTFTTTSTAYVDISPTEAKVTFIAPSSGKVIVELEAAQKGSIIADAGWALHDGTAIVAEAYCPTLAQIIPVHRTLIVAGLTPGQTYTYTWRVKISSGTLSMYADASVAYAGGPMSMKVMSTDPTAPGAIAGAVLLGTLDYTEATADGATKNLVTIPAGTLLRDIVTVIDVPFAPYQAASQVQIGMHLGGIGGTQYELDRPPSNTVENATLKGRSAVMENNNLPKIAVTDLVPQARWLNAPQGTGWTFLFSEDSGNEDISGGTFTITINGITTAPIAWNANAATVLAAAKAAFGNGNVVSATDTNFNNGNDGGSVTLAPTFQPTSPPSANLAGLTGGSAPYTLGGIAANGVTPTQGHITIYRL